MEIDEAEVVRSRSQVLTWVARVANLVWWVARDVDQVVRISSRDLLVRRDWGWAGCWVWVVVLG